MDANGSRGRRAFLTGCGATMLGGVGSGCLSGLPPLGSPVSFGRVDVPSAEPPRYRRWVPAASALQPYTDENIGSDGSIDYTTPGNMGADAVGVDFNLPRYAHVIGSDYGGIEYEAFDRAVETDAAFVGEGDVDRDAVADTLERTNYERSGSVHGYDLYVRGDNPRALAVGDGAIVNAEASTVENARGRVEVTVGAAAGSVQRYHETETAYAVFTDRIGSRPWTDIGTPRKEATGYEVGGTSYTFDENAIYYLYEELYPSGDAAPSEDDIREQMRDATRAQQSEQVEVSVDDQFVAIRIRIPRSEVDPDDAMTPLPYTTWGYDVDADEPSVTFRHEAGDTIQTDRLSVESPGGELSSPFGDRETVGPGDSVTVPLPDTRSRRYARIEWAATSGDSTSQATLISYEAEVDG